MATTVTLTGTYTNSLTGIPHTGRGFVEPSTPVLLDSGGDVVALGGQAFTLDANGRFSVDLPASDDPAVNPQGFTYRLGVYLTDGTPKRLDDVYFLAPAAVPTLDVADITPVPTDTGTPMVVGPQGEQGIPGPIGLTGADSVIPGPKGDPGGWVTSSALSAAQDLNTVITAGLYVQGSAASTTTVLNYPMDGWQGWVEVMTSSASRIIQRATAISSSVLGSTAPYRNVWYRTYVSGTWSPWAPITMDGLGIGSPEGVLIARVGTHYTDTAGINGAWRWLKKTGTGATGWKVVDGDTGTRNISASLLNGWTGFVTIRRTNYTVEIYVTTLNGVGLGPSQFLTLPDGFKDNGASASAPPSGVPSGGLTAVAVQYSTGAVTTVQRPSAGTWRHIFTTTDAWPTTLP